VETCLCVGWSEDAETAGATEKLRMTRRTMVFMLLPPTRIETNKTIRFFITPPLLNMKQIPQIGNSYIRKLKNSRKRQRRKERLINSINLGKVKAR